MARNRRLPSTLGRMTDALETRLQELLGVPCLVELSPVRGYWTQSRADVMQFTGNFRHDGAIHSIGCWESMSDCLRYGFDINDCRGESRSYADFTCSANGRRVDRSDSWYSAVQLEEIARPANASKGNANE